MPVRLRIQIPLLPLTVAALLSCGRSAPGGGEQAASGADLSAPIRTDTTAYMLAEERGGWGARIPFTFANPAADTLYAVNCNGAITLQLERREPPGWSPFWIPMTNACLSPPVVIPPGAAHRDTLELWGAPPGGNVGPAFPSTDLTGTYRLVWTNLLAHYDDRRPGLGDTVPVAYRSSNEFELLLPP